MTVKISVSISDQQAEYARKQVAEGRFSSTSAVVQQALEAKRREDEAYEAWKAGFQADLLRRADGPHIPLADFRLQIDDMLKEERKRLGLAG